MPETLLSYVALGDGMSGDPGGWLRLGLEPSGHGGSEVRRVCWNTLTQLEGAGPHSR
ncbi:hypothetical protein OAX78_01945 [Planctomycetota bacterium]|nr:hypothetical protein [Planctomycetota bacterium]